MDFIDLSNVSIPVLLLIFLAASVVVWIAGNKLSALADDFAERTGLGRAFIGLLLLGGITSLPEVATTVTASLKGNAGMAVSNILGGISMQVAILAVVDFWVKKQPVSSGSYNLNVLLQGILLSVMLALTAVFTLVSVLEVAHISFGSIFIFLVFLTSLYLVYSLRSRSWVIYKNGKPLNQKDMDLVSSGSDSSHQQKTGVGAYLGKKGFPLLLLSFAILIAGYFVITASEVIAEETGLSGNFIGLVLVAITTSLPEMSTTLAAVKMKKYDMAFSNIFGTNLFDVALIFIADLLYFEGPVLSAVDDFAVVAAMLGIMLTTCFLTGIISKSKKQVLGVGLDSIMVILFYLAGIFLLYQIS